MACLNAWIRIAVLSQSWIVRYYLLLTALESFGKHTVIYNDVSLLLDVLYNRSVKKYKLDSKQFVKEQSSMFHRFAQDLRQRKQKLHAALPSSLSSGYYKWCHQPSLALLLKPRWGRCKLFLSHPLPWRKQAVSALRCRSIGIAIAAGSGKPCSAGGGNITDSFDKKPTFKCFPAF